MKRRDLERYLRAQGVRQLREGGNHSFWGFDAERSTAVSRHREIDFRLVRKICLNCRTEYEPPMDQIMELNLKPDEVKHRGMKFFYGAGCDKCNNLGFKGRTGIYEMITMTDELRDHVSAGASTDVLRQAMRKAGTRSLRDAGMAALHAGVTTIDEIVRETVLDEEG